MRFAQDGGQIEVCQDAICRRGDHVLGVDPGLRRAIPGAEWANGPELQGVYAHVDLEFAINEYFKNNGGVPPAPCPPPGTPDLHTYLQKIYKELLKNTAVAGLALGAHWCLIAITADGVNDWSYLDEAFAAATNAKKNVQLLITPGVNSPSWLFLEGQSCDPVIKAKSPIQNISIAIT